MIPELADWQAEAHKRAAALRVDPSTINEASGVIRSAFGDRWLQEACARDAGHPLPLRAHPIGNFLTPPGDNQIIALLELSEYLIAASSSPIIGEILASLKAQYGHTFLQLAFAYRFARIGAINVELEPPVQRGLKGDIACTLNGRRLIAECYIPRVKRRNLEADWLLQQCLALRHGQHSAVLSVSIKLKVSPNAPQRKTIVRLVRELAAAVDRDIAAGNCSIRSCFAETDAAYISVARSVAVRAGEDSVGVRHPQFPDLNGKQPLLFGRVSVGRATVIRPGYVPEPIESRDHVAIWLSDEDEAAQSLQRDLDAPIGELLRKLERKLSQAKLDPDVGRVLIVSSWMTSELQRASPSSQAEISRTLFQKHRNVAGILLVLHSYHQDIDRYNYQIVCYLPEDEAGLSRADVDKLLALEASRYVPRLIL